MDWIISLIGGIGFGLPIGLFLGKLMLPPREDAKVLRQALKDMEEYHKATIARMRGRLKEYEQPSELQQIAGIEDLDQLVQVLSQNLGGIKGIPKWLRPFIPAIQSYIKENPEKVREVLDKFIKGERGSKSEARYDIA